MPKFDAYIFELLDKISNISNEINTILEDYSINSTSQEIELKYSQRAEWVNELINTKNDENWETFFSENKTKFLKIIDDINYIEDINIHKLKNITSNFSEQLKNLNKNKSLLIYTK